MKKKFYYRTVAGKEYPCRIIRKYGKLVDIQIQSETDDTYFVGVPVKGYSYAYKPQASLVIK